MTTGAFGWAGFTGGHRAYLRCFPDQDAALVVLANSAGPLLGPRRVGASSTTLLPDLLELLEVPALPPPAVRTRPTCRSEHSPDATDRCW